MADDNDIKDIKAQDVRQKAENDVDNIRLKLEDIKLKLSSDTLKPILIPGLVYQAQKYIIQAQMLIGSGGPAAGYNLAMMADLSTQISQTAVSTQNNNHVVPAVVLPTVGSEEAEIEAKKEAERAAKRKAAKEKLESNHKTWDGLSKLFSVSDIWNDERLEQAAAAVDKEPFKEYMLDLAAHTYLKQALVNSGERQLQVLQADLVEEARKMGFEGRNFNEVAKELSRMPEEHRNNPIFDTLKDLMQNFKIEFNKHAEERQELSKFRTELDKGIVQDRKHNVNALEPEKLNARFDRIAEKVEVKADVLQEARQEAVKHRQEFQAQRRDLQVDQREISAQQADLQAQQADLQAQQADLQAQQADLQLAQTKETAIVKHIVGKLKDAGVDVEFTNLEEGIVAIHNNQDKLTPGQKTAYDMIAPHYQDIIEKAASVQNKGKETDASTALEASHIESDSKKSLSSLGKPKDEKEKNSAQQRPSQEEQKNSHVAKLKSDEQNKGPQR